MDRIGNQHVPYTIMPGPPYDGLAIGSTPNWSHGLPILYGYGNTGSGTVYSLIPPVTPGGSWTEKELYAFTGINGLGDEYGPSGAPAFGPHGTLYGTTLGGGTGAATIVSCDGRGAALSAFHATAAQITTKMA